MAKTQADAGSAGIGFIGLLVIAFIVLKLCGVIDWSWWWVVSPVWIIVLLVVALWIIVACAVLLSWMLRRR